MKKDKLNPQKSITREINCNFSAAGYWNGLEGQCYFNNGLQLLPEKLTDNATNYVPLCSKRCREKNFQLAGLVNGISCYCGDHLAKHATPAQSLQCTKPCPGDRQSFCGGTSAMSVYSTGYGDIFSFCYMIGGANSIG